MAGNIGAYIAPATPQPGAVQLNSITSGSFASGVLVTLTIYDVFNTAEAISGFKAGALESGGRLVLANAASGLRLPSIGVVPANYVSGDLASVIRFGQLTTTACSGWSGFAGTKLYVGSGGMIVTQSGLLSGMGWQSMGVATSGGILLNPCMDVWSGGQTLPMAGAAKF